MTDFPDLARAHLQETGTPDPDGLIDGKRSAMLDWYESGLFLDDWDRGCAIMRSPTPVAVRLAWLDRLTDGYLAAGRAVRVRGQS